METRIDAYGISDIGKRRFENQDQFLVGKLQEGMSVQIGTLAEDRIVRFPSVEGTFLIVADGMGGHVRGTVASAVAVECFARYLRWRASDFLVQREVLPERLTAAVRFCDRTIHKMCRQRPNLRGMGTTFTAAYVLGRKLYVVHVGDSRCYLLRRGTLDQLTTDHTLAQLFQNEDATGISPAAHARMSHALWNCLGGDGEVEVEIIERDLRLGDLLVLCSDGLSKYVDARSISAIATGSTSVQTACRRLVTAANDAGGSDNITVVVGRWVGEQDAKGNRTLREQQNVNPKWTGDTDPYLFHNMTNDLVGCETSMGRWPGLAPVCGNRTDGCSIPTSDWSMNCL